MSNEIKTVETNTAVTPMALLEVAMNQNADVDKLEKLWELQQRWEASEARKAYNQAIAKFRSVCPAIKKTRQAHNSKYAGLSETLEQVKPHLEACGLSHSWRTDQSSGVVSVTCMVTHILGHSEATTLMADPDTSGSKNSIQSIGSTVTYLQRYTFNSILGLASTDDFDDDGDAAGALDVDDVIALFASADTLSKLDVLASHGAKLKGEERERAVKVFTKRKEELSVKA